MSFYYLLESCDNSSVRVNAQFQTQQQTFQTYKIYGLAPGQGVGDCWKVAGLASSGQFVYLIN